MDFALQAEYKETGKGNEIREKVTVGVKEVAETQF